MDVRTAIIASALRVTDEEATEWKQRSDAWQAEALGYRNRIGEVRYAADFYARSIRRLRLFVGEINEDGDIVPTEDAEAIRVLDEFQDPGGGRSNLLTQYARLMFITGEGLALGDIDPKTQRWKWEILSPLELRQNQSGEWNRYQDGGAQGEPIGPDATVIRLWSRDPTYSRQADSPLRASLDICEELAMSSLVIRAKGLNRLSGNGLLFVPDELSIPGASVDGDSEHDDNLEEDPIFAAVIKAMLASIEDLSNASAVMPVLLRGPAEAGAEIKHITLRDPNEEMPEFAAREKTVKRLAVSLDMPPEALTGVGDVNHWGGWQIERDSWRHTEPIAQQLIEDLTAALLVPTLVANNHADPYRFVVQYDAAAILTNPDRGEDAKTALELGAIGYEPYRDATGWSEEDAPTEEDLLLLERVRGAGAPAPAPEEDPAGGDEDDTSPTEVEPEAEPEDEDQETAVAASALAMAADIQVLRHREAAGARLRSSARGKPWESKLNGVANVDVAAAAPEAADDPGGLVRSTGPTLFALTASAYGIDQAVIEALVPLIERHAARTLTRAAPTPFPPETIRTVLDRASA